MDTNEADVVTVDLARRLRDAGVRWVPARGDRFVLPDRGMDADVFVVSDMTVDVHQFPAGPVIGFNGTVEWALDSVMQDEALWLPSEESLRRLLGRTFRSLVRVDGPDADGYRVTIEQDGERGSVVGTFEAPRASDAYALALLSLAEG